MAASPSSARLRASYHFMSLVLVVVLLANTLLTPVPMTRAASSTTATPSTASASSAPVLSAATPAALSTVNPCPTADQPSITPILTYLGPSTATFGHPLSLAAQLTDASGLPLMGRSLAFALGSQAGSATTDANGVAQLPIVLAGTPGSVVARVSFAGDTAALAAEVTQTLTIARQETLLSYTGPLPGTSAPQQQFRVRLNDAVTQQAIANAPVQFRLGASTPTTATTDATGVATGTLTFSIEQAISVAPLQISFAGDPFRTPAQLSVPASRAFPAVFGSVVARHPPIVNGIGRISGTLRVLTGETMTLNSGAAITGDLLLPGTPTIQQIGHPTIGAIVVGSGSPQPSGYRLTLNGEIQIGRLVTRTDPISMAAVSAPPAPTGTRDVTLTQAEQSFGNPATLRNLTLTGSAGAVAVPPGTYGQFSAGGETSFVLGVAGATAAAIYNLQGVALNQQSKLRVVGPVVITLAHESTLNGLTGVDEPGWLTVNVATGKVTINGGSLVRAILRAPSSQVVLNENSRLRGALFADRLTLNGGAVIEGLTAPTSEQAPALVVQQVAPLGVLPGQAFEHTLTLTNTAGAPATQVLVQERFSGSTPVSATASLGTIGARQVVSTSFTQTTPTLPARQATESPAAYQSRLAAVDGQRLRAEGTITFANTSGQGYTPLRAASATVLRLPRLTLGLAAPACVSPGSTITYTLRVSNLGSAAATNAVVQLRLPDDSTQAVALGTVAAGATTTATVAWSVPPIPTRHTNDPSEEDPQAGETSAAYLARLRAVDGTTLSARAALNWQDARGSSYGTLEQQARTTKRLPIPTITPQMPTTLVPGQTATLQLNVQNVGSGNAASVQVQVANPDTTQSTATSGALLAGQTTVLQTSWSVPSVAPKGASESDAAYQARLAAIDSQALLFGVLLRWTDAASNPYGVTSSSAASTTPLPIVPIGLTGPGSAQAGDTITYTIILTNTGHSVATDLDLRLTLLDGRSQTVASGPPLAPGEVRQLSTPFTIPATHPGGAGTTQARISWQDQAANSYGPLSASHRTTIHALPTPTPTTAPTDTPIPTDTPTPTPLSNYPPVVDAGADQTVLLTPPPAATTVTLQRITTGFNSPIGIDYHQPSNKVVMSVHYFFGQPYNFELVAADGSRTAFSSINGLTDELKLATAREDRDGRSLGGFLAGELFTGSGVPGVIVRIAPDGTTIQNPWVTLPGEGGLLRGSLYVDRTGVFGGDLIVVTTAGNVWRVNAAGSPTRLANLGTHLEGLVTVPDDPTRYGPWAGKILAGAEQQGRLYAIDRQGNTSFYHLGIDPEDIDLIPANENFFGIDFGGQALWGAPATAFSGMAGDLLIAQEVPGILWRVYWDGNAFQKVQLAQVAQWEHVTFAPAGIREIPPVSPTVQLDGTVHDDGLPLGSSVRMSWHKVSGPGTVGFSDTTVEDPRASFSEIGTYVLELTANDSVLSSSDQVTITLRLSQPTPTPTPRPTETPSPTVPPTATPTPTSTSVPPTATPTTTPTPPPSGPSVAILDFAFQPDTLAVPTNGTVTWTNSGTANHTVTSDNGFWDSGTIAPGELFALTFTTPGTYAYHCTIHPSMQGSITVGGATPTPTATPPPSSPPVAQISSPTEGMTVTTQLDVIGTASSTSLRRWQLEYRLTDDATWTTVTSGTTVIANGVLGRFDPTLLLNGIYELRLTVTDSAGRATIASVNVVVEGQQKVGIFTLSFTDLEVPVAGIPIQVIRTYDSRDKRTGDFGVGWTLDLKGVRTHENGVLGERWGGTRSGSGFPTYCIQPLKPHLVTITLPDGTVYKFEPTLSPQCQQLAPPEQVTIGFRALPGTTATLAPLDTTTAFAACDWSSCTDLELLDSELEGDPIDPNRYQLTLQDGRKLEIVQRGPLDPPNAPQGLVRISDLNGNTLTFSNDGITHSSGKGVMFTRDVQGRITQISDPAGNAMIYTYDTNGDLVRFTDREANASAYTYNRNHDLLSFQDPRGVTPIRNEYDDSGRLLRRTDADGNIISYTHELDQQREIITDRLSNEIIYEYDDHGNIISQIDVMGSETHSTYDSHDNLLAKTNVLGQTTTYTYDEQNNLLSRTDPLGNVNRYTYNNRGQVLTTTDARGGITTNTYDSSGQLLTTRDPLGHITSYTYTTSGLRASITDPLGYTTHFEYDSAGNQTRQIDPLGLVTSYTYDANGNQLTQEMTRTTVLGVETLITTYHYDGLNHLVETIFPDGSTTRAEYNSIGQQSAMIDQLGHRTTYTYDKQGGRIRTTYPDGAIEASTYDAEGRRSSSTDRAGRTTRFTYDPLGRLIRTTYPDGTSTNTTYNALGQTVASSDERGNITRYVYDAAGRQTQVTNALGQATRFAYDASRNQRSITDANGNITTYDYDAANRRTRSIFADGTTQITTYDAAGRRIAETDQAGQTTRFGFDPIGRLILVTDALSQTTRYTYDEGGNQLTQTDANNHTTRSSYDRMAQRVRRTLPLGMVESSAYDIAGNLLSRTDFNGMTTTYQYDLMRRLIRKIPDARVGQPPISFMYTLNDHRASMVDASGTTIYTYDLRDRLISKVTPAGALSYTYNAGGNLLSMRSSNANGTAIDYTYDTLNRLATVNDHRLTSGTTTYTYDVVGNLNSSVYPNSVETTYTYNQLNQLTEIQVTRPAITLASYTYTLGPAGNRLAVAELSGRRASYTYDALYRLTNETISGEPITTDNATISYIYDPVGNRLTRNSTLIAVPPTSHTYDADDRLDSDAYDANGNTIRTDDHTYTYDFEDRLTGMDGNVVTIVYDGDGNRVAKTVGGVTTRYLVDDRNLTGYPQVVEEVVGGAVQRQYTYGLDLISQNQLISGTGMVSFYGYDGHGSVRFLTNTAGVVTDRYDYEAFGQLVKSTGTTPNIYLYAGEQHDASLKLYYLRARYYNQNVGRFTRMDSFEGSSFEPQSLHKYLYCANNPINCTDPSGLDGFDLMSVATFIAVIGIVSSFAMMSVLTYKTFGYLPKDPFESLPDAELLGGYISVAPTRHILSKCRGNIICGAISAGLSLFSGVGGVDLLHPFFSSDMVWIYGYLGVSFGFDGSHYRDIEGSDRAGYSGLVWNTRNASDYERSFYCSSFAAAQLAKTTKHLINPNTATVCAAPPSENGPGAYSLSFGFDGSKSKKFSASWAYYCLVYPRREC